MTKHTPGPWRVGHGSWVVSDTAVTGMDGSDAVEFYGGHLICESVNGPNSHLIAAAPDLLEACEAMALAFVWYNGDGDFPVCNAIRKIRAAIAKATEVA